MDLSRRDWLKVSLLTGTALALPLERSLSGTLAQANRIAESALPAPFSVPFSTPSVIRPVRSEGSTDYFRVSMEPTTVEIVPGYQTQMWGYNGQVPGPTFQVAQGREAVVRQVNNLPSRHPTLNYTPWTSVHLHGSASLPEYDGYASDITNPGGWWKDYRYPNWQNARTLWYHDHGVHHTAENVYMGLAGMYQIHDPLERRLRIPHGEFDVPLIISDMMFNADGSLLFDHNEGSGVYGDVITVNGRPWPAMKVKRRKYRFRILNCSISRSYVWSLSNGSAMKVIATDGGLMPAPKSVRNLRHEVGERYEVVIDFAKYAPGTRIVLRNASPKNNLNYTHTNKVMAFDVVGDPFSTKDNSVPSTLYPAHPAMVVAESEAVRTRTLDFVRQGGEWTINGQTWDDVVRSGFNATLADPAIGDVEIWELRNPSGGWHHPVHLHFVDFRVLSRNGLPPRPQEIGPKDVVNLAEYDSVKVLVKFEKGRGKYMIHCHNLTHEDHDMMGQFEIKDDQQPANQPYAVPPQPQPEWDL